jgi:hypothetical protein
MENHPDTKLNAFHIWKNRRVAAIHMSSHEVFSNPQEYAEALERRQNEIQIVLDFLKRRQDEISGLINTSNKQYFQTIDSFFPLP